MRRVWLGLLAMGIIAFGAGCRKAEPSQTASPISPAVSVEGVSRVHWLGKKRLSAETNAAYFLSIWDLPASAKVEEQLLDKLSQAPWRRLKGDTSAANASVALLRPLLDDLVQEECYVEAGAAATNPPGQLVFAIRLSDERSRVWEKNLAAVLESLTGIRPATVSGERAGWSLKKHDAPNLIELTRIGEWTVVAAAQETNALLAEFAARIQSNHSPFAAPATNYWLTADLDSPRVMAALSMGGKLPADWPKISLRIIGDGESVRTRGELSFRKPLPIPLESWVFPTNLVRDPLIAFTAIRGLKPWLSSLKAWQDLNLGDAPDQFYCWGMQGVPIHTYFAVPSRDASNQMERLTPEILEKGNAWLATNGIGQLARSQKTDGVTWAGPPLMSPFLQSRLDGESEFLFGGLFPPPRTNPPPPADLFQAVFGTNLVGYDWELTGPRILGWIYAGQMLRLVLHQAQFPAASPCMEWFNTASPKLGNCLTVVTRTGPAQLSFDRKSSFGLTSVELHLLADWLESPDFPSGLHTFRAPPEPLPPKKLPPSVAPR